VDPYFVPRGRARLTGKHWLLSYIEELLLLRWGGLGAGRRHHLGDATLLCASKMNFRELRHGVVRSSPLSRTPVDNERLGSNIQTLTTPELKFRALLTKDGAQRLVLART
jgi:hypothetical protein